LTVFALLALTLVGTTLVALIEPAWLLIGGCLLIGVGAAPLNTFLSVFIQDGLTEKDISAAMAMLRVASGLGIVTVAALLTLMPVQSAGAVVALMVLTLGSGCAVAARRTRRAAAHGPSSAPGIRGAARRGTARDLCTCIAGPAGVVQKCSVHDELIEVRSRSRTHQRRAGSTRRRRQPASAIRMSDMTMLDANSERTASGEEAALRRELAAVYRLVHHYQMTDLIFTHISARLPGPEHHFLINPYGLMFDEITASSLVVVDLDGHIVRTTAHHVNPAGFVIHSAIHRARPDANSVLHTHTKAGCAIAAQRDGLLPLNQMSMEFIGDIGYHDYEGVALDLNEQHRLVTDLGVFNSLVLRHHGLLTVGESPSQAFLRMFYLERACQLQIAAQSAAITVPPPEVITRASAQMRGQEVGDSFVDTDAQRLVWAALMRQVHRFYPDYAD
jgi:ribulose-5-phosphate 4-epimerase/fuculose-1-phosphate aldolase